MSALDWWRLSYALTSSVIFVLVLIEFKARVKGMDREGLYWAMVILGFIFSSILASLESMYFNDHLSVRTPLYMACAFWCVLALREGRLKDRDKRKED